MSRSSDKRFLVAERAAVEPIAALVAVLAVGAALGLYTVALDDATPDHDRPTAEAALDRLEPVVTVGGIVEPGRLHDVEAFRSVEVIEITADGEVWRVTSDGRLRGDPVRESEAATVAERTVTVRTEPGRNVQGTLRVVIQG